jgi:protein-tyrosine phosphatase
MSMAEAPTPASASARPWKRGVAWLFFLGPFFFLSYGFSNHLAAERGLATSLYYAWERHIPFLPWTIVPYWSIDLLYGFSFLCCRTSREVDRHALRLLTAQIVAVACFLAFPLRFAFDRPASDGLFGTLFDALTSFDQPYNQAPSLHIALLVLIWIQFARLRNDWPLRFAIDGWALLIGISVLTTWQHHFVDLPTGAALGLFCLWLWPDNEQTSSLLRQSPLRKQAFRLAVGYALGTLLFVGLARTFESAALLFGWIGIALAIVGWNYAWAGSSGFQKRDGRLSLAAASLLAPYTLGAWINSRLWTRHAPHPTAITDDVWLGRLPTAKEMKRGGFTALYDLTAELPAPLGSWRYLGSAWLDLVPPDCNQLLAAARDIETLRGQGPMLVACALGYSRSAGAVAAWLCLSGHCRDMATAIALLTERRPQIVIGPALRKALVAVEAQLTKQDRHD